jgi:CBS domain-containing protein
VGTNPCMRDLELPTVRLATLRRLLAGSPSPLVFASDTPIAIVEEALWDVPHAKVVLVDDHGALVGVLSEVPLVRDHDARAVTAMTTRLVILEPEHDIETAIATLSIHRVDHVVVALEGVLIGVLSRDDLERAHRPRRAA